MEETEGIILFEEIEPGTLQYRELIENIMMKENGKLTTSTKLSQLVKDYASTQNAKKETAELDQLQAQVGCLEYLLAVKSFFRVTETSKLQENYSMSKHFYLAIQPDQLNQVLGGAGMANLEAFQSVQATFREHKLLECILQVRLSQRMLKKHADGACILLE
jgi:hypothetical protein